MMRLPLIAFLLLSFTLESYSQALERDYSAPNFSLTLQKGITVEQVAKVIDYQIYAVGNGRRQYFYIYTGNSPDFNKVEKESGNQTHFSIANTMDMYSQWSNGRLVGKKILIDLRPASPLLFPKYVMIWTNSLSPDEMQIADRMISSIQCRATSASELFKEHAKASQ